MYPQIPRVPTNNPYGPVGQPSAPGPGQPSEIPGTGPFVQAQGWFGAAGPVWWDAAAIGKREGFRARWQSPTFDLRPEFGKSIYSAYEPAASATPVRRNGGGTLMVAVELPTEATRIGGLNVFSFEEAAPADPTRLFTITQEQCLADYFTPNKRQAMPCFTPPGSGSAVRFWRVNFVFEWVPSQLHADPPPLIVQGAFY
jgi:hypothetical protein